MSRVLKTAELAPGRLMLEITEGIAMHDPDVTVRLLTQLNALGVSIVIDDFGLGYSSLAYLKRFPINQLKIDRSFVQGLGIDQRDELLVEAVIALTRALGIGLVAEGVERADQVEWLRHRGCRLVQGFVAGSPASAGEMFSCLRGDTLGGAMSAQVAALAIWARLADRDFSETYSDSVEGMDQNERFERLSPFVDKYEAKVEEHGEDRLRIIDT